MRFLLFIMLAFSFQAGAQELVKDTTYLAEQNGGLFEVHESLFADGKQTMERTPVTDTAKVFGYWSQKVENTGLEVYKAASIFLKIDTLMSEVEKVDIAGRRPLDTVSAIVAKRMEGKWTLNGTAGEIKDGKFTIGAESYKIVAICVPWVRLVGDKRTYDFFLQKTGFADIAGNIFQKRPDK